MMSFPQRPLRLLALSEVTNVALNDLMAVFLINVADKLHFPTLSFFGLELQFLIADIAFFAQFSKRVLARLHILEQTDFPEFPTHEFVARVTQQLQREWIHISDFLVDCIENKDAVSCGFKEPPVARFGSQQLLLPQLAPVVFVGLIDHFRSISTSGSGLYGFRQGEDDSVFRWPLYGNR